MKRALLAMLCLASTVAAAEPFTNSVGMQMRPVAAGSFDMGEGNDTPAKPFGVAAYLERGDWDERRG